MKCFCLIGSYYSIIYYILYCWFFSNLYCLSLFNNKIIALLQFGHDTHILIQFFYDM